VFTRHMVGIITHDTAFTLALCWLPAVASKHSATTDLPQESCAVRQPEQRAAVRRNKGKSSCNVLGDWRAS
jgi:hypothetical protein